MLFVIKQSYFDFSVNFYDLYYMKTITVAWCRPVV